LTTTARRVLADLVLAHSMLEDEEDQAKFRVLWAAAVGLSRTVGDVLDKVDRHTSPNLNSVVTKFYKDWKDDEASNKMFFDFIKTERDLLMHEYRRGYQNGDIPIAILPQGAEYSLDEGLFSPMIDGPFAGADCRDVLLSAIAWWGEQLDKIDQAAMSS
jgi:hypothetical protein